jgi:integrase/recombinase XerD
VFHLERFFDYLEQRGVTHVGQLTFEHLNSYRAQLETATGRWGKPFSENHIFAALHKPRIFLRWAYQAEHTLVDFTDYPLPYRPTPNEVQIPTVDQVRRVLEAPDPESPSGRRDRLILESFYTLGLRRRESHRLDVSDVSLSKQTIRVVGKRQRERLLPLSDRLCKLLDRYFREVRPALRPYPEEPALWVSHQNGTRLSFTWLRAMVRRHSQKVGLEFYPHLLRHACATHMMEAGADIKQIQAFLGHLLPSSTQRYTHVTCQELKSVHQATHPRAGEELA